MAHLHNIYDSDIHFKLDLKTRTFSNETELKLLVAQGDHNSEIFTFEIPRYIEQHDMLKCNRIEIHYINISSTTRDTSKDVYYAEDLQVSPEDENIVIFSWPLRGNATKYNGSLSFSISFKCLEGDEITYRWNTLIYSKISVGKSLNNAETIAQEYSDVLEKWKLELIEAGTLTDEDISSAVNDYMDRNPISLSSLEQDEEHRLVTDSEKETWNSKSNFSGNYEDLTNKPTIPTKTSQLDNDSEFSTFSGSYNDLSDKPTIPSEYTLPIATPTTLGGVKPIAKTDEMTQVVGIDELGGLFTREGVGNIGEWKKVVEIQTVEDLTSLTVTEDMEGNPLSFNEAFVSFITAKSSEATSTGNFVISVSPKWSSSFNSWGIYGLTLNNDVYHYVVQFEIFNDFVIERQLSQKRVAGSISDFTKWAYNLNYTGNNAQVLASGIRHRRNYNDLGGLIYELFNDENKLHAITIGTDMSTSVQIGAGSKLEVWVR